MQLSPKPLLLMPSLLASLLAGVLMMGATQVLAQAGQASPGVIDAMPNLPQPYLMRDWKTVARGADSLMFDADATGDYLPLVRYRRPYNGNRLTDSIFGVPSYVGDQRGEALEAILTLPSVVSGLLVGINKRDQHGVDYVRMTQDWYSRRDEENVYLNLPLTSTGNDWWYETMPNVFFQHIYDLAAPYGVADQHFERVAQQWTRVVMALGGSATPWQPGNFNYRSFRIRDLTPVSGGVPQPEAAGAIAYILDNAWRETGNARYRHAAEQALEYLDGLENNPRYELQLYYGAQAAARLNAIEGTRYNLDKIIGWTLSRGALRGWGVSTATTSTGIDLDGLVGEAGRGNDYLFYMNGVQAVATLAPIARYDNRFARAIGKYVLNVANNSRLFYSPFLSPDQQDSYAWASTYDPQGYLAYEALRQRLDGQTPFATGDAIRLGWAPTNIGLYGSAHTGYLAAVVDTTDVAGILSLNLNATDFLGPPSYPSRLVYNPHADTATVTLPLPADAAVSTDLYEAISNTFLQRDFAGQVSVRVPGGEARVYTWTPAGGQFVETLSATTVDGIVIDYSTNILAPEGVLRLKAAVFAQDSVARGDTVRLYVVTDGPTAAFIDYGLLLDGLPFTLVQEDRIDATRSSFLLRAGTELGDYEVPVRATAPALPNTGGDEELAPIRIVAMTSGVRDVQHVKPLRLSPNPATTVVRYEVPAGEYRLELRNAVGQLVHEQAVVTVSTGGGHAALAGLPAGVYTLTLSSLRPNYVGPSGAITNDHNQHSPHTSHTSAAFAARVVVLGQ